MGFLRNGFADQKVEIDYQDGVLKKYYLKDDAYDARNASYADPAQVITNSGGNLPSALPILRKPSLKGDTQQYTGIIRNKTKTDITVPSQNSAATLTVPAGGWIEYTIWRPRTKFTAYLVGNPIRCFNICVKPKCYPFMCKDYDFMAVIDAPEKPEYYKKYKKRVRKKRKA